MYRAWKILEEYSLLLLLGAAAALVWANFSPDSYHSFIELPFWQEASIGQISDMVDGRMTRVLNLHFLINDILMALFFAIAGKTPLKCQTTPANGIAQTLRP